ncbi:MAG: NAD(P)-dependent oxidoreductase, partial [Firmicutes bacterium]|nr:NAD(P)-dependent oxidoreductase [Bacillota bacterium]
MMHIGFIGLGTMGLPMARNLQKAGFPLTVFNRTPDKVETLRAEGARVAFSPAQVAEQSDVVITMLTADDAVREVLVGTSGVKEGAHPGLLVIDCSTIGPKTSQSLAQELSAVGVAMLDAPVTGSEPQAIDGVLTFMVGGDKAHFDACTELFSAMGKGAYHMGGSGAGCYTKLANNTMTAINLLSFAEALTLATKAGIDPEVFAQVVAGGGARSGIAENKAGRIVNRDFRPQFMTELLFKDLNLATDMANGMQLPLPVLGVVRNLLQMAMAKGLGREDMSAVIKCYEDWAGVEVVRKTPV